MRRLGSHLRSIVLFALALALGVAAGSVAFGAGTRSGESGVASAASAPTAPYSLKPPTCPAGDSGSILSSRAGAGAAMVPPGAQQVLLCRYNGLPNPPPLSVAGKPAFGLVAQHLVLNQATVTGLASQLNAIPVTTGVYSCPADFGTAIIAYFGYASGTANPVKVGLSGCEAISNGHVDRLGLDAPVVSQLEALVPLEPVRPARIDGDVWLCGGPAPGRCRTETLTVCGPTATQCFTTDRVTISKRAGGLVETVKLHQGRFAATVPPGRYRVSLLGDGSRVHGKVLQTKAVTARAGRTATVRFLIAVP